MYFVVTDGYRHLAKDAPHFVLDFSSRSSPLSNLLCAVAFSQKESKLRASEGDGAEKFLWIERKR